MSEIRNMSIWKAEEPRKADPAGVRFMSIEELNLSVRSYNCMRRAGCCTVGDVLRLLENDGEGLMKIRGLGTRSAAEIREKIEDFSQAFTETEVPKASVSTRRIIRPARKVWDRDIASFRLSDRSMRSLKGCGIDRVGDLYETDPDHEPGWYAVRELFERIAE